MKADRDSKGNLTYTYTTSEGRVARLDPVEVLHIPGLGFDGVVGYSPIALEKSQFGQGGHIGGVHELHAHQHPQ